MCIELVLIQITGKEAFDFLQGLLTCDMRHVGNSPQPGALCNHQGRVIASFDIQKTSEGFAITLPKQIAENTTKALQKYARFSTVHLETITTDKKLDLLNSIQQKIAVILPETSERFTPHDLNYQNLDFISFDKGCYVGQEIIARMHYLGKLKKQLQHITTSSPTPSSETEEVVNTAYNSLKNIYEKLVVVKKTVL
jgi:folate-binding protein YgfZ